MKKIAYVLEAFPNLSETFIFDQMIFLASSGHQVCVYHDRLNSQYPHMIDQAKSAGIQLRDRWIGASVLKKCMQIMPYRLKTLCMHVFDCLSDFRLNDHDVVLAHFGHNGRRLTYSKKYGVLKKPFITFFHGYDIGGFLKNGQLPHYKDLLTLGDVFLAVNEYFKNILLKAGTDPQKTHVHHMGINCQDIPFAEFQCHDPIQFITVGRIVEKKGILYALEALQSIAKTHPHLNWQYEIIGAGPLQPELKQRVIDYGLQSKIIFPGSIPHDQVKAKLAKADIFLLPSITAGSGDVEGIPVVLMEAMGAGLLACSTYHSGIPELIEHQKTGLLTVEKDSAQLAENILWAIQHPDLCKTITKNARSYVEQEFNQEILHKELLNYL